MSRVSAQSSDETGAEREQVAVEVPMNDVVAPEPKPVDALAELQVEDFKPRSKPKLRGIPDVVATLIALPAATMLVQHAAPGIATFAATVYGVCLTMLFATSATYHTFMWSVRMRSVMRFFDHSMVYVLIAGSYTPLMLMTQSRPTATLILSIVWGMVAMGVIKSAVWATAPRWLNTTIYLFMGWLIVPYLPELYRVVGTTGVEQLAGGGVAYTVGAVIYARRWPNPSPEVFGYHEVFHLFVVAAAMCHFVTVWNLVG